VLVAAFVVAEGRDVGVVSTDVGAVVERGPLIGVVEVEVGELDAVEDASLLDPLHPTARETRTPTIVAAAATHPAFRDDAEP
jgi:hypothetical protein